VSVHDAAYRQLGEAQAIRLLGKVTARHPTAYPLQGLLQLQAAADRYGHLIGNRERVTFEEWAVRIEADVVAGIDPDRDQVAGALREMHRAAQPSVPCPRLLERLRRKCGRVSPPDTTVS